MIPQGWRQITTVEKLLAVAGLIDEPQPCKVKNVVTGEFTDCYFPDFGSKHIFITTKNQPTPCVTFAN